MLSYVDDLENNKVTDDTQTHNQSTGTSSLEHPGVQMVAMKEVPSFGGSITGLNLPDRVFPCATPAEVRDMLPSKDGRDVVFSVEIRSSCSLRAFHSCSRCSNVDKEGGGVVLVHPRVDPLRQMIFPERFDTRHMRW